MVRVSAEAIRALRNQALAFDPYGGLHIVIDDFNIDNDSLAFAMRWKTTTQEEALWCRNMMALTLAEREAVLKEIE